MNPRLPFLALVGLAVGGALLASEGRGRDEPASAGGDGPTIESPGSTWFCAGGSAAGAPGEGFADHTVVVTAGPEPVTGRLTVVAGDHAPPPPTVDDPAVTTTTDDGADDDGTTTPDADGAEDDEADEAGVDETEADEDGADGDGTTARSPSSTTAAGTASTVATSATAGAGQGAAAPIRERTFDLAAGQQARFRLADVVRAPLAAAVVEVDHPAPATTEPWATATTAAPGAGSGDPGLPAATVDHEVTGPAGTDTAPCADHSASTWHFAWGATTRDASERLVLFNPFPNDVAVDAVFSTDRGVREPRRWQGLTVPARSVVAVDVGEDVTRRGHVAATLQVRGGRLVVDRVQAFDGRLGSVGVSVAAGVAEATTSWLFADGVVEPGHATRIVLYNPGEEVAEVDVVVGIDPGAIAPDPGADDLTVGAGGRLRPEPFGMTVRPGRYEVLDLGEQSRVPKGVVHSVAVRSTNGVPVVAERVVGTPDPAAGPRFDGRPPLRITPDSPAPAP